jgi:cytochrome c oxidase subunit II
MVRNRGGQGALARMIARARAAVPGMAVLASGAANAALVFDLQPPVTPIAREMYDLNVYIFWICVVIFCLVFGVMFYSIFKHRKSVGHKAAQFHENTTVEIVWTVIPFLILLGMAWPATKTILAMKDTTGPDITIKVTGYQWKWNYDYLQEGFGFYSNLSTPLAQIENREKKGENYLLEVDHPMVVPIGAKVRVLITAGDVLHSWSVPAFGVKQDAIPGFVRDSWFKAEKLGTYRGQCSELCGKEHGFMPVVVEVRTKEDYAAWVAAQKAKVAAAADDPAKVWTEADLATKGAVVYAANCAACHQANGKGLPGAFPALDGSKIVNGPPKDQIHIVLAGKPGTAMPSWKQLSDTDIAAVITYTRNSWGNHSGEAIQPAQVVAARKEQ